MKPVSLFLCTSLLLASFAQAQTYLSPDWLVQSDLPLSTGPTYVAGQVKTLDDATFVIGSFRNGADFDLSPSDTAYVQTVYNHSQFLAKYDKDGKLLFQISLYSSFYDAYVENRFSAIASDAEGNAYITGYFGYGFDFDPGPGVVSFPIDYYESDVFVAKYDKDGHLVFALPISSENDKTYSEAIAADKQGNVYVAGTIAGSNNDFDPGEAKVSIKGDKQGDGFFAKYDQKGKLIFVKAVTGSGSESINNLSIDKHNNLLAIGYYGTGTNDFDPGPDTAKLVYKGGADMFFAKYSPDGNYLFAKSVGGKGNDYASAIITDSKNNIVITGSFSGTDADFDPGKGKILRSAARSDLFIEKLDSSGNYKWVNTAGGTDDDDGNSLVSDKEDNVFITGSIKSTNAVFHNATGQDTIRSAGGYDIVYAKYDSNGGCRYVQRIGGKADDFGSSIVLTGDSLITFTGSFIDSLDFNPSSKKNRLYAPNTTTYFATYKKDNGAYASAKEIGVFGYFRDESDAYGIEQDKAGNTYIIGHYTGITDFDPGQGTILLTSVNNRSHNETNNVEDPFIAKYDKDGRLLYVRTFTLIGQNLLLSGLAVDEDENLYICGSYFGQINFSPGTDTAVFGKPNGDIRYLYFTKYDKEGRYVFSVNLKSESSTFQNIAVDKQKNIYLTGLLYGRARLNPADSAGTLTSYGEPDMLIAKYDSAGRFVYASHIGQKETEQGRTNSVYPYDMAISDSGRLVVCGEMHGDKTDFDPGPGKYFLSSGKSNLTYFVSAYTLDGNIVYAVAADTATAGATTAYRLALDGEDAVVSGKSYDAADLYPGPDSSVTTNRYCCDAFFIKYNSAGAIQFINTGVVSREANNEMVVNDIAMDISHHIYITGYSSNKVDFDFGKDTAFLYGAATYIARYDSNGNYNYVQGFGSSYNFIIQALHVNNRSELAVAGYGYDIADVDPGPDSLLFVPPAYHHSTFFVSRYQQIDNGSREKLWIAATRRRRRGSL